MLVGLFAPFAFLIFNVISVAVLTVLARAFRWLPSSGPNPTSAPTISRRTIKTSLAWQLGLLLLLVVLNLNREVVLLVLALASFVVPLALLLLARRHRSL